ncbi:MAG: hypothetical protein LKG56_08115 [Lachnospiraceae bacterium]|jgi:hypothetical protein|nr:hypothetical protein [Lachnospiraceae bacterium]MCH4031869.1 hypothetical protein [Lachnospiraceae bacterium]MCH4070493.1 hypothetical protein [Lachnospiraceae bacterium]MCH4109160.1 hypothetical protein [Lachnospiraceae bacterium]MCI1302995.1 hypothetical protein [Lachnospiraceae bacterium]
MAERDEAEEDGREKKYYVTAEDLKKLVRYDMTWKDLVEKAGVAEKNLIIDASYHPAMNDWAAAVRNLQEKKAGWKEFAADWFAQFVYNTDLKMTLGLSDTPQEVLLPVTEEDVAQDLYSEMLRAFYEYEEEDDPDTLLPFQKAFPFEELLDEVRYYREDMDKPVPARKFTDRSKLAFVRRGSDDAEFHEFKDGMQRLCLRMNEELCRKGNAEALRIRGYASYSGGGMYPSDWMVARDSLTAAFEKEPESYLANSLGYIAFYGRCSGGKPQYDEAFRWFSIGAAGGEQESRYKLGDMFLKGLGVPAMTDTAVHLYKGVYDETLAELCHGRKDSKFADAALRLAGVEAMAGPACAAYRYRFALQANYAIRQRLPFDNYGDSSVFSHIQDELSQAGRSFHELVKKTNVVRDVPVSELQIPTDNASRCLKGVVREEKNGRARLTIYMRKRLDEEETPMTLLTMPEADFCQLVDKITFEVRSVREIKTAGDDGSFFYNYADWSHKKQGFVFCQDEDVTAFIGAKELVWKAPDGQKTDAGRMLHFVKVLFSASGRGYDYLCDDRSVKTGDHVIVPGRDGETEVEVIAVFDKAESETDLPVDRYKSVIRKAD